MKEQVMYFTKIGSVSPTEMEDKQLESWIKENYDFEAGYIPEGYNVAMLLVEGKDNPLEDQWKIVFFKKAMDFSQTEHKALTLDYIDDIDDFEDDVSYQEIKVIDTNYEGVIDTSRDLIENYRDEIEESA